MHKSIRPMGNLFLVLILSALACTLPGSLGDIGGTAGSLPGTLTAIAPTPGAPLPRSTDAPDSIIAGGACANPLLPVVLNASWTYHGTGGAGDIDYTDTITEVLPDGFTSTAPFADLTRVQTWICKPEGLLLLDSPSGASSTLQSSYLRADFHTTASDGVTLPAILREGDEWRSSISLEGTVKVGEATTAATSSTEYRFKALGLEEVIVPAGTFRAWKIEFSATITTVMTINGVTLPGVVTETGYLWLAPGVGKVRSVATNNYNGIVRDSSEDLLTYSIP